jgi:hypothetical protein
MSIRSSGILVSRRESYVPGLHFEVASLLESHGVHSAFLDSRSFHSLCKLLTS